MFVEEKRHGEKTTIQHPSLAGFIAWLETMPRKGTYDWRLSNNCACAQYGRWSDTVVQWQNYAGMIPVWSKLNYIARGGHLVGDSEWTYGKCLQRARKAA